jgi:hypothetical protein
MQGTDTPYTGNEEHKKCPHDAGSNQRHLHQNDDSTDSTIINGSEGKAQTMQSSSGHWYVFLLSDSLFILLTKCSFINRLRIHGAI